MTPCLLCTVALSHISFIPKQYQKVTHQVKEGCACSLGLFFFFNFKVAPKRFNLARCITGMVIEHPLCCQSLVLS